MINMIMVNGKSAGDKISDLVAEITIQVTTDDYTSVDYGNGLEVHYKCLDKPEDPNGTVEYYIIKRQGDFVTIYAIVTKDVNTVTNFVEAILAA